MVSYIVYKLQVDLYRDLLEGMSVYDVLSKDISSKNIDLM